MPAENYVLLETIQLSQSAASVTFDNIPQTGYTDLKLVVSGRSTGSSQNVVTKFNGSTTGYTERWIYGSGASAGAYTQSTSYFHMIYQNASMNTANTFGSSEMYIYDYTSSSHKTISTDVTQETNSVSTDFYMALSGGIWTNTSAVTSIEMSPYSSGSFATGSSFSLYGLAALGTTPTVAPKATGGNIVATDGTYWYHAFLSTGIFTPQTTISCDILQVAGGGAGGTGYAGGGAGGLLGFTAQSLSAINYSVVIGAGGAGKSANTDLQTAGSNSQFGSLTASIGGGSANNSNVNPSKINGGSGGGDGGSGGGIPGTGTAGQGNAGGACNTKSGAYPSGGGGGAGAAGGAGSGTTAGNGGVGATYNTTVGGSGGPYPFINAMGAATGTGQLVAGNYYYAGGGGGSVEGSGTVGSGGYGGGGAGGATGANNAGGNGTLGTGGGGGGAHYQTAYAEQGGNGGSGIVIVRYAIA